MAQHRSTQFFRTNTQGNCRDYPQFAVELPGDGVHVPTHYPEAVTFESYSSLAREPETAPAKHLPQSQTRGCDAKTPAQVQRHRSPLQPPKLSVEWSSGNNAFDRDPGECHNEVASVDMSRSRSADTFLCANGPFYQPSSTEHINPHCSWTPSGAVTPSNSPVGGHTIPVRGCPSIPRRSSSMDMHDQRLSVLQAIAQSTQRYSTASHEHSRVRGHSRGEFHRTHSSSTTSPNLIDDRQQGAGHYRVPSVTVDNHPLEDAHHSSQQFVVSVDTNHQDFRGREETGSRSSESLAKGTDAGHQPHVRHNSLELPHAHSQRSKTPSPDSSYAYCQRCKANQHFVSFCPACAYKYCVPHWEEQPLHDAGQRSMHGVPHEKTDPNLVDRILSIIDPPDDDHKQAQLHFEDEQTKWFGVLPDEAGQLQFHDWGRYEEFLGQSHPPMRTQQHPSLISFVGPTGAGKSTIVKALIRDFGSSEGAQQLQTPVVGLAKQRAIPTSGEVHLYWDHASLYGPRPLLFADCEGLGGGSCAPASERAVSARQHRKDSRPRGSQRGSRQDRGSSPESPSTSGRQSPSLRPPLSRVYSHLAPGRAQTGPRPPSNLSLNTTEFHSSPPAYGYSPYSPIEPSDQTEKGWIRGCDKNTRGFTRPIKWASGENSDRQFIVENLYPRLLYTFSDVIVHVMRNVNSLENEIGRLIRWAATAVEKSSNQPMLPYAIIVINAADNSKTDDIMLKVDYATDSLLRDLESAVFQNPHFNTWHRFWLDKHRLDIHTTKELIKAYYSDIRIVLIPDKGWPGQVHRQYKVLLGEIRRAVESSKRKRQSARLLLSSLQFNPYLQIAYGHFSETLDLPFDFVQAFHNFSEPAQGQNPILSLFRCYLHSRRESKANQLLNNVGPIVGSCIALNAVRKERPGSPETLFPDYEPQVKAALKDLFAEAWPCEAIHPTLKQRCVIVRTTHSTKGHQLASGKIWSGSYESSQSSNVDEIFQTYVMRIFQQLFRYIDDSQRAASGKRESVDEKRTAFALHKDIVLRRHGHFLRGGGIVALALGERNMHVSEATAMFKGFATAAFTPRPGVDIPIIGKWIMMKYQSRYLTDGLENSLRPAFGDDLLFGGRRTASLSKCKVAVTTTDTNDDARVLANYNRKQRTESLHMFQRFERPEQELAVWEAARATSAAPGFFKAFHKDSNRHTYWDGALKLNNPIFAADDERRNIWPEASELLHLPDIALSVGTGIFPEAKAARQKHDPGPRYGAGVIDGVKTFIHIGVDAVAQCLDCERVWENYVQGVLPNNNNTSMRFHRLNVPFSGDKIELDHVDKMDDLENRTNQYFASDTQQHSQKLDEIAMQMTATLFYFEVTGSEKLQAPGIVIHGTIKCRFPRTVSPEGSLAKLARGLKEIAPKNRHFKIFTNAAEPKWVSVPIGDELLDLIVSPIEPNPVPFEIGVTFYLQSQDITTAISLHLGEAHSHMPKPQLISGFPRVVLPRQAPRPSVSNPELSRSGSVRKNLTPSSTVESVTPPRTQFARLSPSPSRTGRDLFELEAPPFA
ncbi:hypothetical protein LTR84_003012 [Exophiala bonariae]|uniref:PNPLA domain-containing protein n=1 Tax=Exophiala bonariae TaxID=1690606 RepID=A0AAV9NC79_9EURO|nr:hypothetical protein LTR84_003012 [Exophiala bonariae]